MRIAIYTFAGLFLILAAGLVLTYSRDRHPGALLMAAAYGGSAAAAIILSNAWPLIGGFVLAWLFRMIGLDPEKPRK